MSLDSEWAPDFCLFCDKQSEGPYCSQACRLADLDHAVLAQSSATAAGSPSSSSSYSAPAASTGFYLPPAYDFSAYRSNERNKHAQPERPSSPKSKAKTSAWSLPELNLERHLSAPVSQRSSPVSMTFANARSYPEISDEARRELKRYELAFDRTRYQRRHFH